MFPADGLNREGDMANPEIDNYVTKDTLRSRAVEVLAGVEKHAMPFCPGCKKYHREGHQFCENYPLTLAEILEQQGNVIAAPRMSILEERGQKYGAFDTHAMLTQKLKKQFYEHFAMYNSKQCLTLSEKESIDMIFHKIGRIGNGDPHYKDSWVDIAGYATLIAELCE